MVENWRTNTVELMRRCCVKRATDYGDIKQLMLGNATVMQSTTLQLFDINQTTLVQWHNKRQKRQDSSILLQEVNLPASIPVAPMPLPPVQMSPTAAPPHPGPQHRYHSTAGQAVVNGKSAAQRQLFPLASTSTYNVHFA